MNKEVQFKRFFRFTSKITDISPKYGAKILDSFITDSLGNKALSNYLRLTSLRSLKKVKQFKRLLVVSDLNIGDALIASCGVSALRKIFPDSAIDFAIKNSAKNLILGNPDVTNLYPIYNHAPYPTVNDLARLNGVLNSKQYDVIVNYSPMIPGKFFGDRTVVSYNLMAAELIKNEKRQDEINNINYQAYKFIVDAFKNYLPQDFDNNFSGAKIYLPENSIFEAYNFLDSRGITFDKPIVMLNPDASAVYTRIPFNFQIELIKKLSQLNCTILIGAGHVEKLIEQRIMKYFQGDDAQNIFVVPPTTDLDVYAAIIDLADFYITGDTGPLHIAAARKYSRLNGKSLRNRTAVYSIFGSTPPRIYGYDSVLENFFPANQDAPSKAFIAQTPCRNISCINKMAKACREIRCFHALSTDSIISEIISQFSSIKRFHFQDEHGIFVK